MKAHLWAVIIKYLEKIFANQIVTKAPGKYHEGKGEGKKYTAPEAVGKDDAKVPRDGSQDWSKF